MIDIGAFLVLGAGLFMPLVRMLLTVRLIDTDAALIFAGAALVGLLAAVARYRRIAVISALVYGGAFAFFIVNFYKGIDELKESLKGNPFGGLAYFLIGWEWGCVVITLGVLVVLCSTAMVGIGQRESWWEGANTNRNGSMGPFTPSPPSNKPTNGDKEHPVEPKFRQTGLFGKALITCAGFIAA